MLTVAASRPDRALERGLLQGIGAFRWGAWAWSALILALSSEHLDHPGVAWVLMVGALMITAAATVLTRHQPRILLRPPAILIELGFGIVLFLADGYVYSDLRPQSLAWAWPGAVVLTAGLAFGPALGFASGSVLGIASFTGEALNDGGAQSNWGVTASKNLMLLALAGAMAGFVAQRLLEAEKEIAAARGREEVARTLHDGVLQTLAVIQRRSTDDDLVELAYDQERDLRDYITAGGIPVVGELEPELRAAAARTERLHDLRVSVIVADDLPVLSADATEALVGAAGEALNNAGKHAEAGKVTVYVEPTDEKGVFCSIKDDGTGFDPSSAAEGQGLTSSIRGRIADVGGRVEVSGNPGRGAEVRLWVP